MFLFDDVDFVRTQSLPVGDLWYFLPFGYLFTILVETPILVVGLSPQISVKQRLLCGIWLTACTYPIVVLVLPTLLFGEPRWMYLLVAETFAPVGECLLFWLAFRDERLLGAAGWGAVPGGDRRSKPCLFRLWRSYELLSMVRRILKCECFRCLTARSHYRNISLDPGRIVARRAALRVCSADRLSDAVRLVRLGIHVHGRRAVFRMTIFLRSSTNLAARWWR